MTASQLFGCTQSEKRQSKLFVQVEKGEDSEVQVAHGQEQWGEGDLDNGAGEHRHNLHVSSGAWCSEAGGRASPGYVEMGSQCWEVLTCSKDPPEDYPQCLGMSLAEALCLGCWLQSLPGESHTPFIPKISPISDLL